ncbi:MAG TPA: organomercurial lyase [Planctomycetota bacterium]|nr:organomercurial lyase [Planctomycetota bacterium]
MTASLDSDVRLRVYRHVVEKGHPPSVAELARATGIAETDVVASLRRLAAGRALILGPNADRIAVAPPFSAVPTPFWVETSKGSWWGNCAWESLGIAATLEIDARIRTASGAAAAPLEVVVRGGRVEPKDVVVHIVVPAARWWDDVGFTCSTILFFRGAGEVDAWCAAHGVPRGELLTAEQAWHLAKRWFGGRLDRDWRRLTPAEAKTSLREIGRTGPFWELR